MNYPNLSALVLAAGLSRRALPHHKLLIEQNGQPLIRSVVEAVAGIGFGETLVVVGHERERIEAALEGLAVRCVFTPDYARGMGHSIAAGIKASLPEASGFLVTVGDLPYLRALHVKAVGDEFIRSGGRKHVIPTFKGQRGHPVALGAWLRSDLEKLSGDQGAKAILRGVEESERTLLMEMDSPAYVRDLDQV